MIRAAVAYALFWPGHWISRPFWFRRWGVGYAIYNWLMATSARIQRDGKGPWGPEFDATEDEPE